MQNGVEAVGDGDKLVITKRIQDSRAVGGERRLIGYHHVADYITLNIRSICFIIPRQHHPELVRRELLSFP